jgi:hypothetical protein
VPIAIWYEATSAPVAWTIAARAQYETRCQAASPAGRSGTGVIIVAEQHDDRPQRLFECSHRSRRVPADLDQVDLAIPNCAEQFHPTGQVHRRGMGDQSVELFRLADLVEVWNVFHGAPRSSLAR